MKLSRTKTLLLGIATAWPAIYIVLFVAFVLVNVLRGFSGGGPPRVAEMMMVILPLHFLTMLWVMGLLVVYVLHAFQNEKLDQNSRLMWALLFFVGSLVAMPIYYSKYVWPLRGQPR